MSYACDKDSCTDDNLCKDCSKLFQLSTAKRPTPKPDLAHNACRTCGEEATEHWYGQCWECANRFDVEQEAEPHKTGQMLLVDELIDKLIKLRVKYQGLTQVRIINEDYSWGPGELTMLEDDPNGSYADMNCVFIELVDFGGDPLPSTWTVPDKDAEYGKLLVARERAEVTFDAVGEGLDMTQDEYDALEAAYDKAVEAVEAYNAQHSS